MTTLFKKINFNLDVDLTESNTKGDILFGYGNINYYKIVNKKLLEEINNKFLFNKPKKIMFVEVLKNLSPHIDRGITSCFNYYINDADYTTKFWKIANDNYTTIPTFKIGEKEGKNNRFLYKDLSLVDWFSSKKNDAYILNVGEIHSVEKNNVSTDFSKRLIIQLQWDCNMEELIDIINNNLKDEIKNDSNNIHPI